MRANAFALLVDLLIDVHGLPTDNSFNYPEDLPKFNPGAHLPMGSTSKIRKNSRYCANSKIFLNFFYCDSRTN
jgi:hypothetical protein